MRRFIGMAAIVGMAAVTAACAANGADAGDQTMGQRSFAASGFDKIDSAGSQRVVVTVGGAASVRAEGPQAALDRLEIGVEDGSLHIGNRSGSWTSGSRQPVTIHVTVPALAGASVGGSGMISVNRVEGPRFAGTVGGSGTLLIEQLRVAEAEFSVGGSGSINASGAVQRLDANLGGSGGLDFGGLEARLANLRSRAPATSPPGPARPRTSASPDPVTSP